jgi:hypothetical protein
VRLAAGIARGSLRRRRVAEALLEYRLWAEKTRPPKGGTPANIDRSASVPRSHAPAWERSSRRSAAVASSIREVIPGPFPGSLSSQTSDRGAAKFVGQRFRAHTEEQNRCCFVRRGSPDPAGTPTEGLCALPISPSEDLPRSLWPSLYRHLRSQSKLRRKETFGRALVRGQETRAQQRHSVGWALPTAVNVLPSKGRSNATLGPP